MVTRINPFSITITRGNTFYTYFPNSLMVSQVTQIQFLCWKVGAFLGLVPTDVYVYKLIVWIKYESEKRCVISLLGLAFNWEGSHYSKQNISIWIYICGTTNYLCIGVWLLCAAAWCSYSLNIIIHIVVKSFFYAFILSLLHLIQYTRYIGVYE